jgi:hypothetical protein
VLEVEKLGQTTVGKVKTEWLTKGALSPTVYHSGLYDYHSGKMFIIEIKCAFLPRSFLVT